MRRLEHQHHPRGAVEAERVRENGIAVQATAFGNKGVGVLSRIGAKLVSQEVQLGDKPQLDRLLGAIKVQLDAYLEGRIDALYVASTRFVNTMKQEPLFLRLLPWPAVWKIRTRRAPKAWPRLRK